MIGAFSLINSHITQEKCVCPGCLHRSFQVEAGGTSTCVSRIHDGMMKRVNGKRVSSPSLPRPYRLEIVEPKCHCDPDKPLIKQRGANIPKILERGLQMKVAPLTA
jgi:hypothetical protein